MVLEIRREWWEGSSRRPRRQTTDTHCRVAVRWRRKGRSDNSEGLIAAFHVRSAISQRSTVALSFDIYEQLVTSCQRLGGSHRTYGFARTRLLANWKYLKCLSWWLCKTPNRRVLRLYSQTTLLAAKVPRLTPTSKRSHSLPSITVHAWCVSPLPCIQIKTLEQL